MRNLIVDSRRQAQRQRDLAVAVATEPTPESTTTADERDVFAVVARALPMFIEALDPVYRDALKMTELEGLTQSEAAKRTGVSLSGMKSRVQRGRRQALDSLQRCCEFRLGSRGHMIACTSRADAEECC